MVGLISGLMDGSMGGSMGGTRSNHLKSNKSDLIEIIQFCLKIYDLLRHPHLWVGVFVVGWISSLMDGSMGGTRSNH